MYNVNNIQFIFKQSSEKISNFYYDQNKGLCYSNLVRKRSWTDSVSLQKNIYSSFYIDMDTKDVFHIIFQDNKGNIYYSKFDELNIKTIPILNSKLPSVYNKKLFLILVNKEVHFFYVLKHGETHILSQQILFNEGLSKPRVIDYIQNDQKPFQAISDGEDLYIFYKMWDNKHFQIGYKKYIRSKNFWGEFIPITNYYGSSEYPSIIVDNNKIMHLCYQRSTNKGYELVYQQKVYNKNIWTQDKVIYSSAYEYPNLSIIVLGKDIIVFWVRDDIIYYTITEDDGNSWSKPTRYNSSLNGQLMCMSYKTNHVYEANKIFALQIPGNYANGFKLAFYDDKDSNPQKLSSTDFKSVILEEIKGIKHNIEFLKESVTDLKNNIMDVSLKQNEFEKDITKCSIKVDMFQKDIENMKNVKANFKLNKLRVSENINKLKLNTIEKNKRFKYMGISKK